MHIRYRKVARQAIFYRSFKSYRNYYDPKWLRFAYFLSSKIEHRWLCALIGNRHTLPSF